MSDGSPPTEPCTNRQPPTGSVGKFGEYKDAFGIYEDGKHRRYSLLFAVNGAIAAIVKLAPKDDLGTRGSVLLAVLMIIFTSIMGWDIWLFGNGCVRIPAINPKAHPSISPKANGPGFSATTDGSCSSHAAF
jgi:hypothetical protein